LPFYNTAPQEDGGGGEEGKKDEKKLFFPSVIFSHFRRTQLGIKTHSGVSNSLRNHKKN
jgi:hypothetical protein